MEVAAGTHDAAILDLTLASAMIGEGTDYANLKMVDELNVEEYGGLPQGQRCGRGCGQCIRRAEG